MTKKSASSSAAAPSRRRVAPYREPLVANVRTAAVMCALSERQIKKLIAAQTLRSVLAGGRRLIYVDSIGELLGIDLARPADADSPQRAA